MEVRVVDALVREGELQVEVGGPEELGDRAGRRRVEVAGGELDRAAGGRLGGALGSGDRDLLGELGGAGGVAGDQVGDHHRQAAVLVVDESQVGGVGAEVGAGGGGVDARDLVLERPVGRADHDAVAHRRGGDADVDNYLSSTRSNIQDLEAAVVELKARAVQRLFDDTFISGDGTGSPNAFDGLNLLCIAGQTVSMGAPSTRRR